MLHAGELLTEPAANSIERIFGAATGALPYLPKSFASRELRRGLAI
jgi:hypothetical protein